MVNREYALITSNSYILCYRNRQQAEWTEYKLFNNFTSLFFTHWLFCHIGAKLKIKVFSRRRVSNLLKLLYYKVTMDLC